MPEMIEVNATVSGLTALDFDKKQIRKVMKQVGADVRNAAWRLVARYAISQAGEYPGKRTGKLQHSIEEKVSSGGFWVSVAPRQKYFAGDKNYYPAMLVYGVRRGAVRQKNHRAQTLNTPWRIAPRENFMVDAIESRRAQAQDAIQKALIDAIKPVFS